MNALSKTAARRRIAWSLACALLLSPLLVGCSRKPLQWDLAYIPKVYPDLQFDMVSADTGKPVTAADYRGKIVIAYFGYTNCPDVCPLTMSHLADALAQLGAQAKDVRILFITVDPARDTLPVLKAYTHAFSPQAIGLRGSMSEVRAAAARYHVAFSYGPKDKSGNYVVNHSAGIYVFDRKGHAVLLGSDLSPPDKIAHDLRQLVGG